MRSISLVYFLFVAVTCCLSQESSNSSLPLQVSAVTSQGGNGACSSIEMNADAIQEEVLSLLNSTVIPKLQSRPTRVSLPSCACGGPGLWTRIAHLDMSDPSQQCPTNWRLTSEGVW